MQKNLTGERLGFCQVIQWINCKKCETAPQCLLDKAEKEEFKVSWDGAFGEKNEKQLPNFANLISSHIVYKVKCEETNRMRIKSRLFFRGNKDGELGKSSI